MYTSQLQGQKWNRVSKNHPCPICGKPDWCEVSADGEVALCMRVESDHPSKSENGGWIHQLSPQEYPIQAVEIAVRKYQDHVKADSATLDKVYKELLSHLSLSSHHLENLRKRGLTEGQIARHGYKSLPVQGRPKIARQLVGIFGEETMNAVPGFMVSSPNGNRPYPTLAGNTGILIPVLNLERQIIGLSIRVDEPKDGDSKYKWFSSSKHNNGTKSGTPAHVAQPKEKKGNCIWITEGAIKANIAADLLGETVIGVAGVTNWGARAGNVLAILVELKATDVILAYDADIVTNTTVQQSQDKLAKACQQCGFHPSIASWPLEKGKGLDDLLVSGGTPEIASFVVNAKLQEKEEAQAKKIDLNRPEIFLKEGQLPQIVDLAEEALLAADSKSHYLERTYQRSGFLVRALATNAKTPGIKRPQGAVTIQTVETPYLMHRFTEVANFVKYDARTEGYLPKDCPQKIAEVYLGCPPWKVPYLGGIVEAPTLREDGSILEKPGYDEETGLLFHPGNTKFSPIPQNPTRKEALEALSLFQTLLKDFAFAEKEDEKEVSCSKGIGFAVALSGILTALVRRSLRSAPIHGFDAPKAGSGKSLLVDVVSLIATGRRATVMSQAESPEEEKKRLLAVLMEGDLVVSIDNVERPLTSDSLCSILTQETWKERLLGKNKMVTVSTNVTWFATGNNLIFQGDLATRALICRLDPMCDYPEERSFDTNLYEYIPQQRSDLVKAGLTILRAYHVAGRPKQNIKPYGRFEEWSDWVRSAIVWLGLEDPGLSRKQIEESDPVRANLKRLLTTWYECFQDKEKTVKEVVEQALTPPIKPGDSAIPEDRAEIETKNQQNEALREALLEFAGDFKGNIDPRRLGYRLRKYKGTPENGFCFQSCGKGHGNLGMWKVKKLSK